MINNGKLAMRNNMSIINEESIEDLSYSPTDNMVCGEQQERHWSMCT